MRCPGSTKLVTVVSAAMLLCAAALGCAGDEQPTVPPDVGCAEREISRFQELTIVAPEIVDGPEASNENRGLYSFARTVEVLSGGEVDAFLHAWFNTFTSPQNAGQFTTTVREETLENLVCPWLKRRPENNCNATCSACDEEVFDLAEAPFRTLAISNRLDLAAPQPEPGAGEGRIVFGVTEGAGDDPLAPPMDMTIIAEFNHPVNASQGLREWAQRWHALGEHEGFGPDFQDELYELVEDFAQAENLRQVRVNERVFDWDWVLREFHLKSNRLAPVVVANTPDPSFNGSEKLSQYVKTNADDVKARLHVLPVNLAGAQSFAAVRWFMPGVDEELRHAFAAETCGGCHQTEQQPVDINFHVSPFRSGIDKLSPFVNNPSNPQGDDMARRSRFLSRSLCEG